jgi:hypothetical protein
MAARVRRYFPLLQPAAATGRATLNTADARLAGGTVTWLPLLGNTNTSGAVASTAIQPTGSSFVTHPLDGSPVLQYTQVQSSAPRSSTLLPSTLGIGGGTDKTLFFEFITPDVASDSNIVPLFQIGGGGVNNALINAQRQGAVLKVNFWGSLSTTNSLWSSHAQVVRAVVTYSAGAINTYVSTYDLTQPAGRIGWGPNTSAASGTLAISDTSGGLALGWFDYGPENQADNGAFGHTGLVYLGIVGGVAWNSAQANAFLGDPTPLWTASAPATTAPASYVLPHRKRAWAPGVKPVGPVELDRSHWAVERGVSGLWLPGSGVPTNLATGEIATPIGSPANGVGPGGAALTNAAGANAWRVRNGPTLSGLSYWTVLAVMASGAPRGIFGGLAIYCERSPTNGMDIVKLGVDFGTLRDDTGALINEDFSSTSNDGRPHVLVVALRPHPTAGYLDFVAFADGVKALGVQRQGGVTATTGDLQTWIGGDPNDANAYYNGDIYAVAAFPWGVTDAEAAALSADPYALLRRKAPARTVIAGAATPGGALTGTGALSIAGPAVLGAGARTIPAVSGSGGISIAAPSVSGAGSVAAPSYVGAATLSIAGPIVSAAGSTVAPSYAGSGGISIAAPSVSAAGSTVAPSYAGSGGISIAAPIVSGAGSALVPAGTGAGAVSVAGPTVSGAGSVAVPSVSASGGISIAGPIVSASGFAVLSGIAGSGGISIAAPSVSGAGAQAIPTFDGTGAAVIAGPSAGGVGFAAAPGAAGAGAVAFQGPQVGGAGTVAPPSYVASGGILLAGPIVSGAGARTVPIVTGSGGISIGGPIIAGRQLRRPGAVPRPPGTAAIPRPLAVAALPRT